MLGYVGLALGSVRLPRSVVVVVAFCRLPLSLIELEIGLFRLWVWEAGVWSALQEYSIDKQRGVINFSSIGGGASVVLEYVSDGMEKGEDGDISVNKLFEEYIYAYIKYSLLNGRLGVQEYIVNRARKDKSSLLRNAKIRLSNIHPGRLLMNMRGQDKWLK